VKLTRWNPETDGPLNEAAMRQKLVELGYAVSRYVYPPGTYFPPHSHGVGKIDGVLAGQFRMSMEGESVVLEAGDMLVVPRGVVHSAEVVGEVAVVSLDAVRG
jgi:quercetin dioxygenase-like cupin family protein